MAKLAGGGFLRRWLCLFLIGSAAVCAAEEKKPESVWVKTATTMVLKKGTCVVAIKMEFKDTTAGAAQNDGLPELVEDKLPGPHESGPFFRMPCLTESFERENLEKCQRKAQASCEGGLFVYEVAEKKKYDLHEAMRDWPTPNVSFFINCLEKQPQKKLSITIGDQTGIKCHGGKEMKFEISLVNLYPRIRVELKGDGMRKTEEPWYSGFHLARDLAQDGTTIWWPESVSVECEDKSPEESSVASEPPVIGIVTSPGEYPELVRKKDNEQPIYTDFKEMIKLSSRDGEMEAKLWFFENKVNWNFETGAHASRSSKGILSLKPQETITVTPLLHQEMYPFLGAFAPQSKEVSKDVSENRKRRNLVLLRLKTGPFHIANQVTGLTEDLTGMSVSMPLWYEQIHFPIVSQLFGPWMDIGAQDNMLYLSAKDAKLLKKLISIIYTDFDVIKKRVAETELRFISEGPWKSSMANDSEGRRPEFPQGNLHLNPELFFSYRDLRPSLISYRHEKKEKRCLGKFELHFNTLYWELTAEWIDVSGANQFSNLFPAPLNQKVSLVHDLVGPVFLDDQKRPLCNSPDRFILDRLRELQFKKRKGKKEKELRWECHVWRRTIKGKKKGAFPKGEATTLVFGAREEIFLRSTQIYDVSPSPLKQRRCEPRL